MKGRAPRIIGGSLKGRSIAVPSGFDVRPMRSRVRESLFGILAPQLPGARVLDVFAGSGAIAFEAISRGAASAVLVEKDPRVLTVLEKNIRELAVQGRATVEKRDVYTSQTGGEFDVIFLDPPFPHYESVEHDPWQLAHTLMANLADGGVICIEYPSRLRPPDAGEEMDRRKYGDTSVVMWGNRGDAEQ